MVGYTEFRQLNKGEVEIFKQGTKPLKGNLLEAVAVATQQLVGCNYKFFCNSTPLSPNANSKPVFIIIHSNLDGTQEISEIRELE